MGGGGGERVPRTHAYTHTHIYIHTHTGALAHTLSMSTVKPLPHDALQPLRWGKQHSIWGIAQSTADGHLRAFHKSHNVFYKCKTST